jgi:chorismate-pyruvate lyase
MTDRLEHLHQQIDDLTDPDGDFAVVCPASGKRPVPVRGERFPSADAAEAAVELVCEYRTLLREVDPHLENIPIVAAQTSSDLLRLDDESDSLGRSSRSISLTGEDDGEWLRMSDAPVVHVRRDGELLDDRTVSRQLDAQL